MVALQIDQDYIYDDFINQCLNSDHKRLTNHNYHSSTFMLMMYCPIHSTNFYTFDLTFAPLLFLVPYKVFEYTFSASLFQHTNSLYNFLSLAAI